jgi:hypothetical protein
MSRLKPDALSYRSPRVKATKNDDHTQCLIDANLAACQTSMRVPINEAHQTAKRAHERVDEIKDRLFSLDNPEVGKVTQLWEDREYVQNAVRRALVYMFLTVLASGAAGYYLRPTPTPLDKSVLKQVIKEAVADLKKSGEMP